jgi:hypothetical protein
MRSVGLDTGKVLAFMVDHARDRNMRSAKAMVTSLRAFLRLAHATGRTAVPLAGVVFAVASWRLSALPWGLPASEIERLLAGWPSADQRAQGVGDGMDFVGGEGADPLVAGVLEPGHWHGHGFADDCDPGY